MTKLKIDAYRTASGTQGRLRGALTSQEIAKYIQYCLNPGKAPGPDKCPNKLQNSREKWPKWIFVTGSLCGRARVRPVDKLDQACTSADDRMMLVQHRSGDCVMR